MNRKSLVASFGLVAGLAAALSARAPSSNGNVEPEAGQNLRVRVIGCVEGGAEAGRYILTGAFLKALDNDAVVQRSNVHALFSVAQQLERLRTTLAA